MLKARAEFAIVDGKLLMPKAVITNTRTAMTHENSRVKIVFEHETSVFHEEDKSIVWPEVKECAARVAENFFDSIFNNGISSLVKKLEQNYPEAKMQLTVKYNSLQHENYFTSSFGIANLTLKSGPHGDREFTHDYSKDDSPIVFDSRRDQQCPDGVYSFPLKWLREIKLAM
jgi:hypothetical protein